jgi:hypothetical protein
LVIGVAKEEETIVVSEKALPWLPYVFSSKSLIPNSAEFWI